MKDASEGENLGHPKESCRFMSVLQDTGPTRVQDLAWFSNRDNLGYRFGVVELEFHMSFIIKHTHNYVYFHNMH